MDEVTRAVSRFLPAVPWILAVFLSGCSSGCPLWDSSPGGECLDPKDPCPDDMVTDESGCGWDRCAGEFTGNLMPCWFTDPDIGDVGYFELAGSRSQYLAYVRKTDEYASKMLGPIWLYDLETGEHRILGDPDRKCSILYADGDRVGCLEYVEYHKDVVTNPVVDVYIKDISSGQEWRVPNPERLWSTDFSLSGDRVVVNEIKTSVACAPVTLGTGIQRDLWLYNLGTGEKTLLAGAVKGTSAAMMGKVFGDRVVYWEDSIFCPTEPRSRLIMKDLASGEERVLGDWDYEKVPLDARYFQFDGRWAVGTMPGRMMAWNVETGESKEITPCSRDCRLRFDDGLVAYDRYGEDGLIQRQIYIADVTSGEKLRLTDLRPYYDSAAPSAFHNRRLLWNEGRGEAIEDNCGHRRTPDGKTTIYFWKDIEF